MRKESRKYSAYFEDFKKKRFLVRDSDHLRGLISGRWATIEYGVARLDSEKLIAREGFVGIDVGSDCVIEYEGNHVLVIPKKDEKGNFIGMGTIEMPIDRGALRIILPYEETSRLLWRRTNFTDGVNEMHELLFRR